MAEASTGELLSESRRLIESAPGAAAMFVIASTGAGVLSDIPEYARAGQTASTVAGIVVGYLLVSRMVEQGGLSDHNRMGIAPYVGLAILSTLGIGLAALLLIVPGLFLWVRWSAAYAFLSAEDSGVFDSMKASFDLTRGHFWPIFGALAVPLAMVIGGMVLIVAWSWDQEATALLPSLLGNAVVSLAGLIVTAIGLAVYSLLGDRHAALGEVFA